MLRQFDAIVYYHTVVVFNFHTEMTCKRLSLLKRMPVMCHKALLQILNVAPAETYPHRMAHGLKSFIDLIQLSIK